MSRVKGQKSVLWTLDSGLWAFWSPPANCRWAPTLTTVEDRFGLTLHVLENRVDAARIGQEVGEGRSRHIGGEFGAGVAVEELGDLTGVRHGLHHLRLEGGIAARIGVTGRGDGARIFRQIRLLRRCRAHVVEHFLGAFHVLGALGHQEAVDRCFDRGRSELGIELRPDEEIEIVLLVGRELLPDEGAEGHHARGLVDDGGGGFLPGAAVRIRLLQRQQIGPGRENLLDLVVGPALLAGHQVHVELVAVQAEIELIEGAHRRPAAIVGEGERRDVLFLHGARQGLQLVEGGRWRPAILLEEARAIVDAPGVVVVGHEVELAVIAGRCQLESGRHGVVQSLAPDIVDRAEQILRREIAHAIAGEPRDDIIRVLQIGGDVLLVGIVVGGVDLDRDVLVRQRIDRCLQTGFGDVVRIVRTEGNVTGGRAEIELRAGEAGSDGGGERRGAGETCACFQQTTTADLIAGNRRTRRELTAT